MGWKGEGGVSSIFQGEVGCEVPETAVVGVPDECYSFEEKLGCFGGWGAVVDVGEAVLTLE